MTWLLSVTMMERVLRPWVASMRRSAWVAFSRKRFMGAEPGITTATTRWETTVLPKPMLISLPSISISPWPLFNILHLLPEPLQKAFDLQNRLRNQEIAGLGADGV